ncbi:MAG: EamA family transporter [Chloroflexi bacterium]|nr:EamA family transporter [Chloroflexota bacterium]
MDKRQLQIVGAFAAVYIVWGATYLAIRIAVETIPPFLMAGTRFMTAGFVLHAVLRARGIQPPTRIHWRSAFIIGGLLLFGGNGALTWAEQYVASSLAAVLVATIPLWVAIYEWLQGKYPGHTAVAGLIIGFGGITYLINPFQIDGDSNLFAMLVILVAAAIWAYGTVYARTAPLPKSAFMSVSMEMISGGALLLILSGLTGDFATFQPASVSAESLAGLGFLIVFGSMIAFTAFFWLIKEVGPGKATTNAYVNPVVAVFLGWSIGSEPLTANIIIGAALTIGAVVLMTMPTNVLKWGRPLVPAAKSN